jgi:Zn-dependent M16 (insulinase) family peptidase
MYVVDATDFTSELLTNIRNQMVSSVRNMVEYAAESIGRAKDTLVKSKYLKRIDALVQEDPEQLIRQFEEFRASFCKLENIRILVIANLKKLRNPVSSWKPFVEGKNFVGFCD